MIGQFLLVASEDRSARCLITELLLYDCICSESE